MDRTVCPECFLFSKDRQLSPSLARSKAIKAYPLGWKPAHGDENDGLFESIISEYRAVLEEGKDQAPIVHFDEMYALNKK